MSINSRVMMQRLLRPVTRAADDAAWRLGVTLDLEHTLTPDRTNDVLDHVEQPDATVHTRSGIAGSSLAMPASSHRVLHHDDRSTDGDVPFLTAASLSSAGDVPHAVVSDGSSRTVPPPANLDVASGSLAVERIITEPRPDRVRPAERLSLAVPPAAPAMALRTLAQSAQGILPIERTTVAAGYWLSSGGDRSPAPTSALGDPVISTREDSPLRPNDRAPSFVRRGSLSRAANADLEKVSGGLLPIRSDKPNLVSQDGAPLSRDSHPESGLATLTPRHVADRSIAGRTAAQFNHAMQRVLRRAADFTEGVLDQVQTVGTPEGDGMDAGVSAGAAMPSQGTRVTNTFNINVSMDGRISPVDSEALRDQLIEILRDSARRQGIDV